MLYLKIYVVLINIFRLQLFLIIFHFLQNTHKKSILDCFITLLLVAGASFCNYEHWALLKPSSSKADSISSRGIFSMRRCVICSFFRYYFVSVNSTLRNISRTFNNLSTKALLAVIYTTTALLVVSTAFHFWVQKELPFFP